jgi:hypothetical protein
MIGKSSSKGAREDRAKTPLAYLADMEYTQLIQSMFSDGDFVTPVDC